MTTILVVIVLLNRPALAADKIVATKSFPASKVRSIVVHTEAGRIAVTTVKGGEAKVEAVKPADSEGHCELALDLKAGQLNLEARKPTGSSDICDGGFIVAVPAEVALEAYAGSGDIDIRGIKKTVKARAGSGSIKLSDLRGQTYAMTGSGDIRANLASAALDVRTGSGNIRVTLSQASGLVSARSGSGDIEVFAPKGAKARVKTQSASGRVVNDFHNQAGAPLLIEALTGSGNVTVRASSKKI